MKYAIVHKWLYVEGVGKTMFFNSKDIEWLEQGNTPKLNKQGLMIMPYGNIKGKEVYG